MQLLLPADCRLCGAAMTGAGKVRVCEACIGRVGPAARDEIICSRCGSALGMESARFAAAMGVTECTLCRLAPPAFTRAVAFADFDNEMRAMLHLLKFGRLRNAAETTLGGWLATTILKLEDAAARELLVVPVPLHSARQRQRGFNQSTLLAQAALQRLRRLRPQWRLQMRTDVLQRVKDTRALYRLSPRQRRAALRGAFRVSQPEKLIGREVLLIDDIMTTGATANECARVLLRAGAAKVWVATLAKAQPESVRAVAVSEPEDFAMWNIPAKLQEPDVARRVSF